MPNIQLTLADLLENENEPSKEESKGGLTDDGEVEVTIFTSEEKKLLTILKSIISESNDRDCPVKVYKTVRKLWKVKFEDDGNSLIKTVASASSQSAEKMIAHQKRYPNATNIQIEEIIGGDPATADYKTSFQQIYSFYLDQSLSSPRWFTIVIGKKKTETFFRTTERNDRIK